MLMFLIPILFSVAILTLMERKLLSLMGSRLGPTKVSFFGILQPIGDAAKLCGKQSNMNIKMNYYFYYVSSTGLLAISMMIWSPMSFEYPMVTMNYSLIFMLILMSVSSISSILAGWSCANKYSVVGSIRSVSQMVSYESVLYLSLFFAFMFYLSFSTPSFIFFSIGCLAVEAPLVTFYWLISMMAELNRSPFDLSEGESELVSGFNVDFGSLGFTMIFLAEYSNIIVACYLTHLIFSVGGSMMLSMMYLFAIVWIRAVLPRLRFDKLMMICWKNIIPFMTLVFCFYCALMAM